jgi:RNA polymerase sigma-70 factor (ECF subfamily)
MDPSTPSVLPTEDLVSRARRGDEDALEALLARMAPSIHRFGLRMCRNVHDAEDVLQDVLIEIAKHVDAFEGRSAFSSWVFALTRSACARRRRGLKHQAPVGDEQLPEEPDPAASPEVRAGGRELAAALARALDSLPEDYREAILLRDVEGLSAPEAAGAVGISVDALKSRLHRARAALRTALAPFVEPEPAAPGPGCPVVAELWSKKLEGDLRRSDCAAMEQHILGCPACADACDALKRALLACQRTGAEDVPAAVQAGVRAALRSWRAGETGGAEVKDPRR